MTDGTRELIQFSKEPLLPYEKKDPKYCKGLIFKGKINRYLNGKNHYVETQRMALLKRKSCTGCPKCAYMFEELEEGLGCDRSPIMPTHLEHDQLYTLAVVNLSYDYYSGYLDDWDLEFIKYVEPDDDNKTEKYKANKSSR